MSDAAVENAVLEAYDRYLAGFIASDLSAINSVVQYPLAHIGEGVVRLFDTFPINPAELRKAKQWHTTTDSVREVVVVSPTKAHVVLRTANRVREDGSLIETISAFYAITHTAEGWKMFALSDVVIPASGRCCGRA
jgi:hypothetical protein